MEKIKIEFRTTEYQFSHGRRPRGTGVWIFEYPAFGTEPTQFRAPRSTYTEAKRYARAYVREHCPYRTWVMVNVCP